MRIRYSRVINRLSASRKVLKWRPRISKRGVGYPLTFGQMTSLKPRTHKECRSLPTKATEDLWRIDMMMIQAGR